MRFVIKIIIRFCWKKTPFPIINLENAPKIEDRKVINLLYSTLKKFSQAFVTL